MTATPYWHSLLSAEEWEQGARLGSPTLEETPASAFSPDGRYFISYRSADGEELADEFQTRLRAAGLSAWRDQANLTLGQIKKRLTQAIAGSGPFIDSAGGTRGGLAGAILIATPRVWTSEPVRHWEAPLILQLAERPDEDGFQFAVANAIPAGPDGPADLSETDAVYGYIKGTLGNFLLHDALSVDGRERIVRHLLEARLERRIEALPDGRFLRIHVDSRQPLSTTDKPSRLYGNNDLAVRLHQHRECRWPNRDALTALVSALIALKDAVPDGVGVQFHGRIHPSVALALGATFSTRRPGQVIDCLHETGDVESSWRSDAPPPPTPRTFSRSQLPTGAAEGGNVLVLLVASCTPADRSAFDALAQQPGFACVHRIELDDWAPITAAEGDDLARRLALELTHLGREGDELHLAYVGPWSLGVLLGHHLNTIRYVTYEWDNSERLAHPIYQPSLRINPGMERHVTVVAPIEGSDR